MTLDTVVWLTLENHKLADFTPTLAPYLHSLMSEWASCTQYTPGPHGTGLSLPNYMISTTGEPCFPGDCDSCTTTLPNVFELMDAAGISWGVYSEGLGVGAARQKLLVPFPKGAKNGYDNHHNPAAHMGTWATTRGGQFFDFSQINWAQLPRFTHIHPNVKDCGHTPGAKPQAIINTDAFLKRVVPLVLSALTGNSVCLIWVDNDGKTGTKWNPIPFIACGPAAKTGGFLSTVPYDHRHFLRTVEAGFGLGCCSKTSSENGLPAMSDLFSVAL